MCRGIHWRPETMVDRVKWKGHRARGLLDFPIIFQYSQTLTKL